MVLGVGGAARRSRRPCPTGCAARRCGARPVKRCTWAASAIFSCTVRGVPGWPNTLNRVPELPNAQEGSSIGCSARAESRSGRCTVMFVPARRRSGGSSSWSSRWKISSSRRKPVSGRRSARSTKKPAISPCQRAFTSVAPSPQGSRSTGSPGSRSGARRHAGRASSCANRSRGVPGASRATPAVSRPYSSSRWADLELEADAFHETSSPGGLPAGRDRARRPPRGSEIELVDVAGVEHERVAEHHAPSLPMVNSPGCPP